MKNKTNRDRWVDEEHESSNVYFGLGMALGFAFRDYQHEDSENIGCIAEQMFCDIYF